MKVLVAYDGTMQAKDALRYGVQKVKENGGEVVALHVFNSPLFIDYDAHPWAIEVARKEAVGYLEEAKRLLEELGSGVRTRVAMEEGDPEEEIIKFAGERHVDVLLCPPRYKSIIKRFKKELAEQGKVTTEDTVFDETAKEKMAVVSLH